MGGSKRSNNGLGPGLLDKNLSHVGLTRAERAKIARVCDKYDATVGWVAAQALRSWLNKRAI